MITLEMMILRFVSALSLVVLSIFCLAYTPYPPLVACGGLFLFLGLMGLGIIND